MLKYIEFGLQVLSAFQPLITFIIGCLAVFISIKTYGNAKQTREHNELMALNEIKRDIRKLYHQIYNEILDQITKNERALKKVQSIIDTHPQLSDELIEPVQDLEWIIKELREREYDCDKKFLDYLRKNDKFISIHEAVEILFDVEYYAISHSSINQRLGPEIQEVMDNIVKVKNKAEFSYK